MISHFVILLLRCCCRIGWCFFLLILRSLCKFEVHFYDEVFEFFIWFFCFLFRALCVKEKYSVQSPISCVLRLNCHEMQRKHMFESGFGPLVHLAFTICTLLYYHNAVTTVLKNLRDVPNYKSCIRSS